MKIPYDKIRSHVKWESPPDSDELFPHLYGHLLSNDVVSKKTFYKGEGSWKDALGTEQWLFGNVGDDENGGV